MVADSLKKYTDVKLSVLNGRPPLKFEPERHRLNLRGQGGRTTCRSSKVDGSVPGCGLMIPDLNRSKLFVIQCLKIMSVAEKDFL